MIDFVPARLLGRHVACRAHHGARIGNLFPGIDFRTDRFATLWSQLREAEVENLHAAINSYEKIFGLEIAMSDPPFVCCRQTLRKLLREIECLALWKRTVIELLTQLFTFEQL